MATVSAGLVNVNQLTVTGTQAGAIQASNLTTGNLDLSGNLGVGGVIRGTNGTLDVSGNLNVTGTIVPGYLGLSPMDSAIDWEGVWTAGTNNQDGTMCEIAFIKKPNNTYMVYTSQGFDLELNSRMNDFILIMDNYVPILTRDSSNNITENSVSLPLIFDVNLYYTTLTLSKKLNAPTSDFAFVPDYKNNATLNNRDTWTIMFARRIMKPIDFCIGKPSGIGDNRYDGDWFSQYQSLVKQKRINAKGRFKIMKDIEGLWDNFKDTMVCGPSLVTTTVDVASGVKKVVNKKGMKAFEVANLHNSLKNNRKSFSYAVTGLSKTYFAKENILQVDYTFVGEENEYEYQPFTAFSEVTLSDSITTPLGITSGFKFLTSISCKTNSLIAFPNISNYRAGKPYVGLLLPITLSAQSTLTFDVSGSSSITIQVPAGSYYPHSLAEKITSELNRQESELRVDLYVAPAGTQGPFTSVQQILQNAFYYVSAPTNAPVTVTSSNSTFLNNILGLGTTTYYNATNKTYVDSSGGFVEGTVDFSIVPTINIYSYSECGVFPSNVFKGLLNPSTYYTPFPIDPSTISISGTTISTSFGNVVGSRNPRDLYSAVAYIATICERDIHNLTQFITLCSHDQELYVPDTYDELVYKCDDLSAKIILPFNAFNKGTDIDSAPFIGTHGSEILDIITYGTNTTYAGGNGYNGGLISVPRLIWGSGYYTINISKQLPYLTKGDPLTKYFNHTTSYTYENYFDSSNIMIAVIQFVSDGSTNLISYATQRGRNNLCRSWCIQYGGFPEMATTGEFLNGSAQATLPVGVTATVKLVSIYDIPADSATLLTYSPTSFGSAYLVGIVKQDIVDRLLPDTSGKIVGYFATGISQSFVGQNLAVAFVYLFRKLVCRYFNSNGVDYIINDGRRSGGGYAFVDSYYPFGSPDLNMTPAAALTVFTQTSFYAPVKNDNVMNLLSLIADIHNNPQNYDSSGSQANLRNSLTYFGNQFDFSVYDASGSAKNIYDIKWKRQDVSGNEADFYVNGNTTGKGTLGYCYSTGSVTQSAGQIGITNFIRQGASNNNLGSGTTATVIGTFGTLYSDTLRSYNNTPYGEANMLTDLDVTTLDPIYNMSHMVSGKFTTPNGEYFDARFGPWTQVDAISNHSPKTLWVQLGYDASSDTFKTGALNSSNVNVYNVSIDHPETWRDMNFERYIQAAYAGPTVCRSKSDFGYILNETLTTQSRLPRNIFGIAGLPTTW